MQITPLPHNHNEAATVPSGVELLRANNPGPLTLSGTNTWILHAASGIPRADRDVVVVDPGPALPQHFGAIRDSGRVRAIVLTHHHDDHSEAAPALSVEFGAPVYAARPDRVIATEPLVDGQVIHEAGLKIRVLLTPGHTDDSICLEFEAGSGRSPVLFTGDTLLGGSTTIIAPPTGSLADYFATMRRLSDAHGIIGLPGHGELIPDVAEWAQHNVEYREERLAQLVGAFNAVVDSESPADFGSVVTRVATVAYGVDGSRVAPYVEAMAAAQLRFLADRGDIHFDF
jgi:glyoxylase-like metal-dependent hydrolase (beta-lactamase superfamily II)